MATQIPQFAVTAPKSPLDALAPGTASGSSYVSMKYTQSTYAKRAVVGIIVGIVTFIVFIAIFYVWAPPVMRNDDGTLNKGWVVGWAFLVGLLVGMIAGFAA